jgi:hypothetical protein
VELRGLLVAEHYGTHCRGVPRGVESLAIPDQPSPARWAGGISPTAQAQRTLFTLVEEAVLKEDGQAVRFFSVDVADRGRCFSVLRGIGVQVLILDARIGLGQSDADCVGVPVGVAAGVCWASEARHAGSVLSEQGR